MKYTVSGSDTTYFYTFDVGNTFGSKKYRTVEFKGNQQTLDAFYNQVMSVFKPENKKNKTYYAKFKLGNDVITVKMFALGLNKAEIIVSADEFITLSEKQINSLFGK